MITMFFNPDKECGMKMLSEEGPQMPCVVYVYATGELVSFHTRDNTDSAIKIAEREANGWKLVAEFSDESEFIYFSFANGPTRDYSNARYLAAASVIVEAANKLPPIQRKNMLETWQAFAADYKNGIFPWLPKIEKSC